jgi:xanthine dehydrogenase iron-sulfur cluster and FAD-binding subunit A
MPAERNVLRFLLNGREVALAECPPTRTLLDFLRIDRRLTGTKEGCAEGDCGACTVLVGRLTGAGIVYETVNACIRFLASVDGCHVVTVEALAAGGALHPVQRALVEHHGSQCGFCTPGFVMSLTRSGCAIRSRAWRRSRRRCRAISAAAQAMRRSSGRRWRWRRIRAATRWRRSASG